MEGQSHTLYAFISLPCATRHHTFSSIKQFTGQGVEKITMTQKEFSFRSLISGMLLEMFYFWNPDNCHCKAMRERSENMKRNRIATGMKALFNQEKRGHDHK